MASVKITKADYDFLCERNELAKKLQEDNEQLKKISNSYADRLLQLEEK